MKRLIHSILHMSRPAWLALSATLISCCVMAFAGCEFQVGRESDGLCQPMTTCFRMANVGGADQEKKNISRAMNEA